MPPPVPPAPPPAPPPALSPFAARWLAEIVRRHEERHPPFADALPADGDAETRILARAARIGAREGWRDAVLRWQGRGRVVAAVAAALALLGGFGAAAGALGDGSRAVNVVWVLGALLGVHLVSLALWLAGLALTAAPHRPPAAAAIPGLLGRGGLWLLARLERGSAAHALPPALAGLLGPPRLARWGVGAASHGLWALALAGAAAGLLVLFATRRYDFVWETTILPAEVFVALTALLGQLPAALGFPVPDAATIAASGSAPGVAPAATAPLDAAGRRAWAGWLLGCLALYGLAPRLLLGAGCTALWMRGLRRLRLDLALPGYARLLPASERLGVNDPVPARFPHPSRAHAAAAAGGAPVALALELGADLPWPPAALTAPDGGRLDSREQRRACLAAFAAHPPHRVLVAIDARLTPDRGSLGTIAELAAHTAALRVWALRAPAGAAPADRLAQWRDALAALDLELVTDPAAATAWLEDAPA